MKKRIMAFLLVLALSLSMYTPVFAENADYTDKAEVLKSLGLFLGTDKGFELDRAATRAEAAVMVVRILGQEAAAKAGAAGHPFTDVPAWASPYVGYLYSNNITKGVSETRFGSADPSTAAQYATYLLRALGYDDSKGDFAWDKALSKMRELGIISASDERDFSQGASALRGQVAALSYYALFAPLKGTERQLLDKLYSADSAVTKQQLIAAGEDDNVAMIRNVYGIASNILEGGVLSSEQIFAASSGAVFYIALKSGDDEEYASGSGFFITSSGVAVTNMHVVTRSSSAKVRTADGKEYDVESVLAVDGDNDLAVIKVKGSGFKHLNIGSSDALRVAQTIYCIGSPLGYENTISNGLVSSTQKEHEGQQLIQISAPISPGSSGGALINEYGQVVGVTSSGTNAQNLNFAVPISFLAGVHRLEKPWPFKYLEAHGTASLVPYNSEKADLVEDEAADQDSPQSIGSDEALNGFISGADDVDLYEIKVEAPKNVFLSVLSDVEHAEGINARIIDAKTGDTIHSVTHYKGEAFSFLYGYMPKSGDYRIEVTAKGDGDWEKVPYRLFFYLEDPPKPESGTYISAYRSEFEPNNDFEYANYFPLEISIFAQIGNADDKDYYKFTVGKRSEIGILCGFLCENVSGLRLTIYSASHTQIATASYNSDYDVLAYRDYLEPGDYYIMVSVKDKNMDWSNALYDIEFYTV